MENSVFYGKRRRTYLLTSLFLAEFAISAVCLGQTPVEKVFTQLRQASLEKSPEVKLARSTLEQKRASLYSSWTGWMPRLDFHVSQNTSKDYSFSTSGSFGSLANLIRPQETTIYAYNLEVRAPLFQRSVQLAVVRGYAERDLALTQLILKTSEVSWNLRSIFGAYLLAAYKASTVARSLKIAQANLQEAQLRFRLGQRTVIDVLKAQANLALLEARQSTYDSDQVQAMGKLVDYTGLNEKEIFELGTQSFMGSEQEMAEAIERFANLPELTKSLSELPSDPEKTGEFLSAHSALYRSYDEERLVETQQAKQITAANWPDLSARATYGSQASTGWNDAFSAQDHSYSYGVVLNIPLFSFGSSFSLAKESGELSYSSEIKKARFVRDLQTTLQNQSIRIRALQKNVESLKFSVDKNTEIERLTLKSYQLGRATFLDLQISQNDFLEAKIALAQAQIDLAVLVWQMRWNLGTASE